MPTPNFKLLANSLRLGQPPDPTAAFRVLVEVIQHQEAEIADLRSRVAMLMSRLQFNEAKVARFEATGMKVPDPAPTRDDMADLRMDEESSDGFGHTMSVRRVDVDAVVQRVVAQEPYPMAAAGTRMPQEMSGMPFRPAPPLNPSPGSLAQRVQPSPPYVAIEESGADLSQTAEVAAADPAFAAEGPRSKPFPGPSFAEDESYDDRVLTNIQRRPRGDGE